MQLSTEEKIRIILKRRSMSLADLAKKMGWSQQNLSNKMNRDNFPEKELIKIAEAMDCTFRSEFLMNDTGEAI